MNELRPGGEVPLASSVVGHAIGDCFDSHRHDLGEEIFALQAVFPDEHSHHPQGSRLRSLHLSQHQPFSRDGCLIRVKTGQLPDA